MRTSALTAGTSALVFLALASGQTMAQVDQAGADTIRRGIENYIDLYFLGPGMEGLTVDGDVEVSPQGDRYGVAFPTFLFDMMVAQLRIDPITAELVPTDNGWFDTTWTIPSLYEVTEGDETVMTMSIGNQIGEGLFAPEYQTFLDANLVLERIEVVPTEEEGSAEIDTITVQMDSEEAGPDVFDSTFSMIMAGLEVDDASLPDGVFRIDELSLTGVMDDLHLADYVTFGERINELMNQHDFANPRGPMPTFFGEMAELLRTTPTLLSGSEFVYSLHGLEVRDFQEHVQIQDASFGLFVAGLDEAAGSFGVRSTMSDLLIEPEPPFSNLIPQEMRSEVRIEDLPNDQLLTLLIDFLDTAQQSGPDQAGAMFMFGLQQAVMQSGARLVIPEIFLDLGVSVVDLNGTVRPTPQSALGVAADASLTVTNMAGLIAELQAAGPMAQDAVQGLTVLQTMGERSTGDGGETVHTYVFQVTEAGQMLLNGNDLGPIMNQMMQ